MVAEGPRAVRRTWGAIGTALRAFEHASTRVQNNEYEHRLNVYLVRGETPRLTLHCQRANAKMMLCGGKGVLPSAGRLTLVPHTLARLLKRQSIRTVQGGEQDPSPARISNSGADQAWP